MSSLSLFQERTLGDAVVPKELANLGLGGLSVAIVLFTLRVLANTCLQASGFSDGLRLAHHSSIDTG